jgi:hypothetical protein
MKYFLLFASLLLAGAFANAQTYLAFVPSVTNTPGTLADKSNYSLAVGRQWEVFSLELDLGKTTLGKMPGRDTSVYMEVRPNLNIFQQGKFTNTLTPGIGYIFNCKENLMTELTSGVEYSLNSTVHFNINFGQYFYSGLRSASSVTFWGVSVMKYFAPSRTKGLLNKP